MLANPARHSRMNAFHTIVIGGGPAGLRCATILAHAGKSVLLLERQRRLGPKVCAGGIPPSSLALGVPDGLLEGRFDRQRIRTGRQDVRLTAQAPMVCTVNREKLGQWMEQEARAAGVTILAGTAAQTVTAEEVRTMHDRFRCAHLVGADGSASLVRRFLRLDSTQVGIGVHYQVPGHFTEMEWHLAPQRFLNGYAWIFPHQGSASIGAYAARGVISPGRLQRELRNWAALQEIDLIGISPRAALINFDYQGWRFGNIYLVGDAAGLASGLTGEGIYAALLSGEVAARTILDNGHTDSRFAALLKRRYWHNRILRLTGKNRAYCTFILETLVAALRCGLVNHTALELGS